MTASDMAQMGREDAKRDSLDGYPTSKSEALDNARAFLREGDYQSARYWLAYARAL